MRAVKRKNLDLQWNINKYFCIIVIKMEKRCYFKTGNNKKQTVFKFSLPFNKIEDKLNSLKRNRLLTYDVFGNCMRRPFKISDIALCVLCFFHIMTSKSMTHIHYKKINCINSNNNLMRSII